MPLASINGIRLCYEATGSGAPLVIRDVGHLTNLEAAAAFNAAVKRFLAR